MSVRQLVLLAVALLAPLAPASAAPPEPSPAYTWPVYTIILRGGGLGFDSNQVTVISHIADPSVTAKVGEVWIAERRRKNRQAPPRDHPEKALIIDHQWIDGRTCPALRTALLALDQLPPMRFGSPDSMHVTGLAFDAPLTTLRGPPGSGGGMVLSRTEFVGPLAQWCGSLQRSIESCWRDAPVTIPGVNVVERLGSEADAEAVAR